MILTKKTKTVKTTKTLNGILDIEDLSIEGEDSEIVNLKEELKQFNGCDISISINYSKK